MVTGGVVCVGAVIFAALYGVSRLDDNSHTAGPTTVTQGIQVSTSASSSSDVDSSSTPLVQETALSGYLSYSNQKFHFALSYPPDLKLSTYNESGGAFTASFQDPSTNEGFEVYVTPYDMAQIDETEFKLDEPSGTFNDPTNVVIDGTQATMFYGSNAIMGDTREVWFIHGGFLYEVATYKALDSWLGGIMQTWQFM